MKFLRPLFLYASIGAVVAFTLPLGAWTYAASQVTVSTPEPLMISAPDVAGFILAALFVLAAVVTMIALALYLRTTRATPLHEWVNAWRLPLADRSPPD